LFVWHLYWFLLALKWTYNIITCLQKSNYCASECEEFICYYLCRNSRETTPCSLIRRDSETIGTPGSTTRPTSATASNRRVQSSTRRNFPNSREMEEFFAVPEQRQQRAFAEKYKFLPSPLSVTFRTIIYLC